MNVPGRRPLWMGVKMEVAYDSIWQQLVPNPQMGVSMEVANFRIWQQLVPIAWMGVSLEVANLRIWQQLVPNAWMGVSMELANLRIWQQLVPYPYHIQSYTVSRSRVAKYGKDKVEKYRIPWQNHLARIQDLQDSRTKQKFGIQDLRHPIAKTKNEDPGSPGSHDEITMQDPRTAVSKIPSISAYKKTIKIPDLLDLTTK